MIVVRPHFARSAASAGVSDRSMTVTVHLSAARRKRLTVKGGQALLAKRPIHPLIEAMQSGTERWKHRGEARTEARERSC